MSRRLLLYRLLACALVATTPLVAGAKDFTLLNVSYDPTRELYVEVNKAFAKAWNAKTGDTVSVPGGHFKFPHP